MSLRKMSVSDGNGPAVSLGVTAHAALVDPVVVVVDDVVSGLVGDPLPQPKASAAPAAPMAPSASRRPSFLLMLCSLCVSTIVVSARPLLFSLRYENLMK